MCHTPPLPDPSQYSLGHWLLGLEGRQGPEIWALQRINWWLPHLGATCQIERIQRALKLLLTSSVMGVGEPSSNFAAAHSCLHRKFFATGQFYASVRAVKQLCLHPLLGTTGDFRGSDSTFTCPGACRVGGWEPGCRDGRLYPSLLKIRPGGESFHACTSDL